jgi:hypothetical protein
MSEAPATRPAEPRPARSKGELVFDVLIVLAIGGYLLVAQSYPPIGRQIPTVVGVVALVAAVVQLIGWFVPGMWKFSHGDPADDGLSQKGATAAATEVTRQGPDSTGTTGSSAAPAADSAAPADGPADPKADGSPLAVPIAIGWAAGFLAAILLLGYVVAVPLFFLVYFGVRRSWVLAVVSAVVMGLVTAVLSQEVLGIAMYGGILF